jgi:prepilin-type N-terminal cleavage/methylation domain-containing protein
MTRDVPKGFSLIEIILTIGIVGFLGAIIALKYVDFRKYSEQAGAETVIGSLKTGLHVDSTRRVVRGVAIAAHNPFDDLATKPSNYVGVFPDVNDTNTPPGKWAYQSGNAGNGNWKVVVYRPQSRLTTAFVWNNIQWIVLVVNEINDANGKTIELSLTDFPPVHVW